MQNLEFNQYGYFVLFEKFLSGAQKLIDFCKKNDFLANKFLPSINNGTEWF